VVPAHVRFLDEVFGVGPGAEHPVSETEQPPALRFERGHRVHLLIHTSSPASKDG
jgi:hypothetical protein